MRLPRERTRTPTCARVFLFLFDVAPRVFVCGPPKRDNYTFQTHYSNEEP